MLQCLISGKDPNSWTLLRGISCLALEKVPVIRIQRGWAGMCGCEMHMHKHRGLYQLMSAQPNNRGVAGGVFPSLFWEEGGGRTFFSPSPLVLAFRHSLQS